MNMMELQQLTVKESYVSAGYTKETLKAPSVKFSNLITTLATTKPLWRFVVTDVRSYDKHVGEITVFQHGEELGFISWKYFRGEYGFEIGNDRIEKARERTRAYRTQDDKKALTAIKKTFSPKNVGERVEAAADQAQRLINNQMWEKNRAWQGHRHTISQKMAEFVETVTDQFQTYLRNRNEFHLYEKAQEAEVEMKTLNDLHKNMGKCAIVVQVDGGYIVKTGDKVEMMDDTTLPHTMKAKLGMLKLVDDEHFITNVGGKVKADVFMLTPEEEGESK